MVTSGCDLVGHECAVERREGETREVVRADALRIESEDDLHLLPQALERELPHPVHDLVDLALAGAHRLCGHHDEDPQEVRMAVEQRAGGLDQHSQMFLPRIRCADRKRALPPGTAWRPAP